MYILIIKNYLADFTWISVLIVRVSRPVLKVWKFMRILLFRQVSSNTSLKSCETNQFFRIIVKEKKKWRRHWRESNPRSPVYKTGAFMWWHLTPNTLEILKYSQSATAPSAPATCEACRRLARSARHYPWRSPPPPRRSLRSPNPVYMTSENP